MRKQTDMTDKSENLWLVAGLGNPGRQYEKTWHNAGFMALDILSQRHQINLNRIKFKGLFGRGQIKGNQVILLKPTTYMNLSGESVREAASYFKIPLHRVLVIYDDLDIEIGNVRIREKGGPGTHNGMRSLVGCLGSELFPRIRVGIGPLPNNRELVSYVLSEIPDDIRQVLWEGLNIAADAVEISVSKNLSLAMNRCNKKKSNADNDLKEETTDDQA